MSKWSLFSKINGNLTIRCEQVFYDTDTTSIVLVFYDTDTEMTSIVLVFLD